MTSHKIMISKFFLLLLLIIIVNNGSNKPQQSNKKIKYYKSKYQINKKSYSSQSKDNYKKNYKYYSTNQTSTYNHHKYKKKNYQKYQNQNLNQTLLKSSSNNNQIKTNKINNKYPQKKNINDVHVNKKPINIINQNKNITKKQVQIKQQVNKPKQVYFKQQILIKQIPTKSDAQNNIQSTQFQYKYDEAESQEQSQSSQSSQSSSQIASEREREREIDSQNNQEQISNKCNEKAVYDYNLLVLTWVPNQCYANKDCEKDWLTAEELRSPTIHMFKPYGSSSYYSDCFQEKGDYHCRENAYMTDVTFDYDDSLRNVEGLLYDMSEFWSFQKFTHDDEAFYAQQWIKHGTCYLMNMIQDNPKAYKMDEQNFNSTILIQYFRTAISKYKKLKIDVQPGGEYDSKQQFAQNIGFKNKQTHFIITCNNKNQIIQIIFCYNRSKLPGRQVTIPCTFQDYCDQDLPLKIKQPL